MDLLSRMDPQLRETFLGMPAVDFRDLALARGKLGAVLDASPDGASPAAGVARRDYKVTATSGGPEVRVRHYRPVGQRGATPCLYWVHGGGHVLGSVDDDNAVLDQLVASVGCMVVAVEWRHSPEHPYPAEMDDCYAGLLWTYEHASELAVDPRLLAVGGASSGGGSAAALALLARDRGEVPLCFQLLVYPMLDDRNITASSFAISDRRTWCRESNLIAWRGYVGDAAGTDRTSPYAAPSRATDLTGLPPAFISVGDLDLFLDEDIEYAQRLLQAGVPTELHVYPGAFHGSERFCPQARLSQRITGDRHEALRCALGLAGPVA